jgi:hypothetical protein
MLTLRALFLRFRFFHRPCGNDFLAFLLFAHWLSPLIAELVIAHHLFGDGAQM